MARRRKHLKNVGPKTRVKKKCVYVVGGKEFRKKTTARRALRNARMRR